MQWINYLSLIAIITSLFLSLYIYFSDKNSSVNRYFSIFVFSISIWITANLFVDISKTAYSALFWSKATLIGPILLALFFLFFVWSFLKKRFSPAKYLYFIIPSILLLVFVPSKFNISNVVLPANGTPPDVSPGWLYYPFAVYLIVYLGTALLDLYKTYKSSNNNLIHDQIRYIFIGVLASSFLAIVTNILFLIIGLSQMASIGPLFSLIMIFFIMYAIIKKQLFDIKIIATETLVVFILIGLFFNALFATTTTRMIISWSVFTISIFTGYMLIRSVKKEISQKEKIQKLAQDLESANTHLKELDKVKDDFLSMASHELNTPISAIEGYLSMILDEGLGGKIPDKARQYLESVYKSSKRLANLVKDLLNVSRIESGRIHLIYVDTQIEDIIDQAVMEIAPKAKEANHALTFHKPEKPLPKTWFDITRITEILINMLGNSCKYTPPGGKIEIKAMADDNKIVVAVTDNGKGIPKEAQARVFEKFSQVDVLKDEVKGTGLGMYIAKKFIELHKGQIWFESEGSGKGTTFFFSLPILKEKPYDPHEGEGAVLH